MHRGVVVSLTLASLGGQPTRLEGDAVVARNVPAASDMDGLAAEALRDASRSLSAAVKLAEAGDAEVVSALASEDRGLKKVAIGMAGARRLKDAVPKLTELVRAEGEDHDVVLKAIGALVAIGDEKAVEALI